MADFYVDHDVAIQVADRLRGYGHTAVLARDLGLERAPDYEHVLTAALANRILLTRNWGDFKLLHGAWLHWTQAWQVTVVHAGILVVEHQPPSRLAQEVDALIHLLYGHGQTLANRLYRWRVATGWVEIVRP
jgi:predicted nuclease of predicted toxin-antitoxin system